MFAFAGLWASWRGVRSSKTAPIEGQHQLFGFLTTEANAIVAHIHPKAMPVILTTPDEFDRWLEADTVDALLRQHPLPDDAIMIVAKGEKEDPPLENRLEEGRNIAIGIARGMAALHRAGIVHRDIKPDNIMLEGAGSLKLLDLGVVRVPGLEDSPTEDIPGTPAYMAPEMFEGEAGNEATDIYALGVTMFRVFTGEFPDGNSDANSPPRRDRPNKLCLLRPDLPAWLEAVLERAVAVDSVKRFHDVMEFALEIEAGPPQAPPPVRRPQTLLERAPVQFWQGVAALLGLALILSLLRR